MNTLPNALSTILAISTKTMSTMITTKVTTRTTMTSTTRDDGYNQIHGSGLLCSSCQIFWYFLYPVALGPDIFFYWMTFLVQSINNKMPPLLVLSSHSISQLSCSLKVSAFPSRYHFSLTGCLLYSILTIGFSLFSFPSFFLALFCTF